ncbi:hypothetical protein [Cyanobium sp. ATX-6F1]
MEPIFVGVQLELGWQASRAHQLEQLRLGFGFTGGHKNPAAKRMPAFGI